MSKTRTIRAKRTKEGRVVEIFPDGTTGPLQSETDWERVAAMTDEDICKAADSDPDAPLLTTRQLENMCRVPPEVNTKAIRLRRRMSQRAFCRYYGFALDALQDWEQGRCHPSRAARILLTVIDREPEAVSRALRASKSSKT